MGSASDCRRFDGVRRIDHIVIVSAVIVDIIVVSFGVADDDSIFGNFQAGSAIDAADLLVEVVVDGWRWDPPSRLFATL